MDAKDKAKELFNNYFDYVEAMTSNQQNENAKKCVLIAIEIAIEEIDNFNRHGGFQFRIDFLNEVKKQIYLL